ncbi:hypothetical protein [Tianweitania sp.]|uniref:hypothetical protein n=1 Tax=Tianweitania sp. TaxID=2021634 RepID=UPI0028988655|nr:hypothetical protein [Tianweitania sp.]
MKPTPPYAVHFIVGNLAIVLVALLVSVTAAWAFGVFSFGWFASSIVLALLVRLITTKVIGLYR